MAFLTCFARCPQPSTRSSALQSPRAQETTRLCSSRAIMGVHSSRRLRSRCLSTAQAAAPDAAPVLSGEDFYSILGVSPAADIKTIKSAYYNLMREYHPDQQMATASDDSIDTNEFCALLNEIYQTLSNPDARDMYDAIAGFSLTAVNPFMDTSYPVDQVFVDEVSCIGCGKCVRACPGAFFIEASKYGRARVVPGSDALSLEEEIQVAIETCPVDCIHWVTSPQLSLLEATLASMDRVDAFIMMRQQRSPGNVFAEANRAWQKRQANLAALHRQDYAVNNNSSSSTGGFAGWASFWSQHVEMKSSNSGNSSSSGGGGYTHAGVGEDDEGLSSSDPARKRVAALAAAASRAMRRWKIYHQVNAAQKALAE